MANYILSRVNVLKNNNIIFRFGSGIPRIFIRLYACFSFLRLSSFISLIYLFYFRVIGIHITFNKDRFFSFLPFFLPSLSLYLFFSFLLTFFLVYNRVATQTEPQSSQRTNLVQPSQSYQTNFHYRVLPILIHLYEGTTICAYVSM